MRFLYNFKILQHCRPSNAVRSKKMAHKVWILNLDDFVFKSKALDALKTHSLKYIQLLKPGDFCVLSPLIHRDQAFLDYMARIKKIAHKNWVFLPKEQRPDESLVAAISRDEELLKKLRRLCAMDYVVIPLIYTKEFGHLSWLCENKLLNNSIAVQEANNKLVFKELCKKFGIPTIAPVYEAGMNKVPRILATLNPQETYLLRRPFSAGGYGNIKGNLVDLLPLIKQEHKEADFYLERYKEIYKTLGSLCMLKDDEVSFVGIDSQLIHKEAWEGCSFPFQRLPKGILDEIREKSLMLACYYYGKGVRGQINIDWAIRKKDGELKLRALECNSRYNGFGLCLRLASTVYGINRRDLHFYMDTKMRFAPKWTTQKLIDELDKINAALSFKGGVVLTSGVEDGKAGFCFIATNAQDLAALRKEFKRHITGLTERPTRDWE